MHNIWRSKDNQTINLVSWQNITWKTFFLKYYKQNVVEKLVPDPFQGLSLINSLKLHTVCFNWILSWGLSKYIEPKLQTTCFYLTLSIFKKWKDQSTKLVYVRHFYMIFEEKYFSCYSLLIDQISLSGCFYLLKYWTICVFQLLVIRLWHHEFWN